MTTTKTDPRPWHKKKRFIIPGIIIVLIIMINLRVDKTDNEARVENQAVTKHDPVDFKTELKNNIKSIDGDDFTFDDYNDPVSFVVFTALYKAYGRTLAKGKLSNDDSIILLTKTLEQKLIRSQKINFPRARLAYQKMLRNKLWENDIDVSVSGTGNRTLNFTGAVYAANRNIKETQDAIREMATYLRFRQVNYRWYNGAAEYQYFTIKSEEDDVVGE